MENLCFIWKVKEWMNGRENRRKKAWNGRKRGRREKVRKWQCAFSCSLPNLFDLYLGVIYVSPHLFIRSLPPVSVSSWLWTVILWLHFNPPQKSPQTAEKPSRLLLSTELTPIVCGVVALSQSLSHYSLSSISHLDLISCSYHVFPTHSTNCPVLRRHSVILFGRSLSPSEFLPPLLHFLKIRA